MVEVRNFPEARLRHQKHQPCYLVGRSDYDSIQVVVGVINKKPDAENAAELVEGPPILLFFL